MRSELLSVSNSSRQVVSSSMMTDRLATAGVGDGDGVGARVGVSVGPGIDGCVGAGVGVAISLAVEVGSGVAIGNGVSVGAGDGETATARVGVDSSLQAARKMNRAARTLACNSLVKDVSPSFPS